MVRTSRARAPMYAIRGASRLLASGKTASENGMRGRQGRVFEVGEQAGFMTGSRFTRRRFLKGLGAAFLTLASTAGCEPLWGATRLVPVRTPRVAPLGAPKVWPLSGDSPTPPKSVWAFRSRPDLSPPAIELIKKAHHTAPGYIFLAPEKGHTGQGGSLIIDNEGQVVWFRPLRGTSGRTMNFEVQTYRGEPVLTWGETPGEYVIFDDSYHEIARFGAANGYSGDHHEFVISPQNTALITIYDAVPKDLSSVGGSEDGSAVQGTVQEVDIETGEVLFEWRSLDHVGLDETYGKPGEDVGHPSFDYFHINSIDVDHDDNLLISARKTCAVYKIDRTTGEIVWRLGGKKSDFEMGPGARFAFQHDARRLPDGTISIFDNGPTVYRDGFPMVTEESRAIILELDERKMKASLVREYTDGQHADAAGNTQALANGNVFVGWGRALSISEFGHDGKPLFDARLQPGNRSYRAFRFPWSAQPPDRPAAAAERTSEAEVRVYASWNGATGVERWEVLAGPRVESLKSLGAIARDGFETAMVVRTSAPYVAVRAKDRLGRTLGTAASVKV